MPTGEAPAVLPTGPEPEDVDVKQFYVPSDALDACDAPGAEAAALAERLIRQLSSLIAIGRRVLL